MASSGSLLIGLKTLRLGLRSKLVQLRLASLINTPGLGIKSSRVVTKSLELLVFGTTSALEADARLACTLSPVVSTLLRRDVLRVGSTSSLTGAADADRGTREAFESGLVDARFFRGDGGFGVERVLETAVRLVIEVAELERTKRGPTSKIICLLVPGHIYWDRHGHAKKSYLPARQ